MDEQDGLGDSGERRAPEARRPREENAPELARQVRNELTVAVDSVSRAGGPEIPGARTEPDQETTAEVSARDALLDVSVLGHRLARLLDGLSARYATPGRTRPPDAHVALDQAAAAAEDLGNSAQTAARAIEEEEEAGQQ